MKLKFKSSDFSVGDGDFSVEIAKQANARLAIQLQLMMDCAVKVILPGR